MSGAVCSSLITNKLEQRAPFSLIRLGDGEGVLLSMCKQSPDLDLEYLARHLGPDEASLDRMIDLKMRVVEAIIDADVVGVRDDIVGVEFDQKNFELPTEEFLEKFRKRFKLRDCEKDLPFDGARRIALLHSGLSNINLGIQTQYCSSWVHYDLHLSGSIFKSLMTQRKIGLITSRQELCPKLEEIFGITVSCWDIPDMYCDLEHDQISKDYINKLDSILQQKLVEFPGMLFLVGGGLFGKLYCSLIKSQGGIALDVGSLLDAWVGVHSRPAVYRTLFSTKYNNHSAPKELFLSVENVRRMVHSI